MNGIDQWVEELGAALAAPDPPLRRRNEPSLDKKWRAGDIAAEIPPDQLKEVADKLGVSLGILRSYADVARAFLPAERVVKAPWTTYRELRKLPREQRREVMVDGMTLRQARLAAGKGRMDRPKLGRGDPRVRAYDIINELQDEAVREIVLTEMQTAGVKRHAKKAVRTTLDEISAQKRAIEAELRKQAKEPTPDRQYWIASKELTEASRLIHGLARLHGRGSHAMPEERWQEIVERLRTLRDSADDAANKIIGIDTEGIDVIDVDELPDALELPSVSGSAFDEDHEYEVVDAEIVEDEED